MMFSEVDVDITDTEEIIVRCPDYVAELGRLLKKTSPRSVIVGAGSNRLRERIAVLTLVSPLVALHSVARWSRSTKLTYVGLG